MSLIHSPARTQCDCCDQLSTIFKAWNAGLTLEDIGRVVNDIALAKTADPDSAKDVAIRDRLNGWEYDVAADNAADLNSEKQEGE